MPDQFQVDLRPKLRVAPEEASLPYRLKRIDEPRRKVLAPEARLPAELE